MYRRRMTSTMKIRRYAAFSLLLLLLASVDGNVVAQTLSVDGSGDARVEAALSEFGLTATLRGAARFHGNVTVELERISFVAEGSLRSIAVYEFMDLVLEGWLLFQAAGTATGGTPIEIHGLLHLKTKPLAPLRSGETVSGIHCTRIDIGGETQLYRGSFTGSAVGETVPSDEPFKMALAGTGSVHLAGCAVESSYDPLHNIPLNHAVLTSEFIDFVRTRLLKEDL